jgi:ribosomal protein S18 acetylase RimI-like enzyme
VITISKVSKAETYRFKSIRMRSLKESPNAFGTSFKTALSWDDANWASQVENLNTFIASCDGEDVGVARSVVDKDDPRSAWIISMWVATDARGKKVASQLVQEIIKWAKQESVQHLKLDVVDSNKAAISLYEKLGFTANGVVGSFPEPRSHITEHQRVLKV